MSGPRRATVAFSCPRRQVKAVLGELDEPLGVQLRSAAARWRADGCCGPRRAARPRCPRGSVALHELTICSHSSIASAATSGATSYGSPAARVASARWIVELVRHAPGPEPGVVDRRPRPRPWRPGPASRSVPTTSSPVSASQASSAAASSPSGPSHPRHLLLGDVLLGPGRAPAAPPSAGRRRCAGRAVRGPVRAGRHGRGQVGPGRHAPPQQPDLVGRFRRSTLVLSASWANSGSTSAGGHPHYGRGPAPA